MNKEILTRAVIDYKDGNADSLAIIFREVYEKLFIYAKYIKKREDEAEDLLQNTFVEIIRSIGNLKNPEAFLTWSKRIMWHLAQRDYRASGKEVLVDQLDEEDVLDRIRESNRDYIPEEKLESQTNHPTEPNKNVHPRTFCTRSSDA